MSKGATQIGFLNTNTNLNTNKIILMKKKISLIMIWLIFLKWSVLSQRYYFIINVIASRLSLTSPVLRFTNITQLRMHVNHKFNET